MNLGTILLEGIANAGGAVGAGLAAIPSSKIVPKFMLPVLC